MHTAYKYAGVQAGYACLCGDTFGKHGKKPDSECNTNCPGDNTQKCGAGWRNAVYSTGYMGKSVHLLNQLKYFNYLATQHVFCNNIN